MSKVIVLGGSGMLGSMTAGVLAEAGFQVTATVRGAELRRLGQRALPAVRWTDFDAAADDSMAALRGADWVVNAVGITKPLIHDDNAAEVERAVRVNALFPHRLAAQAERLGLRVLQIATDCVYSGQKGDYAESDVHDALDAYGKTKSLGEVRSPNVHHLRCSIIGPEPKDYKFLVEWFRRQPRGAAVSGYVNHRWNGVTTLHFARFCAGVIRDAIPLGHCIHVVPTGVATKAEMLKSFTSAYRRPDIAIREVEAEKRIDRVLRTEQPDLNARIWRSAGYDCAPTVDEQIHELSRYDYPFPAAALAAETAG